jgi:DNA helicase HerA-like ATPase
VAIDLTGCNTISLFGVQGFGKSYTLGVIAEMASVQNDGINVLTSPLATVIFHFHKSDAYEPEYVTAVEPNRKISEVDRLLADYGGHPKGLQDVVLLAPEAKVEARRREYPGVTVQPIKFSSAELGAESWKFLMGAVGNSSLYVRQIVDIMQSYGDALTLADLEKEIDEADFSKSDARFANIRLRLAKRFIDDTIRLRDILRPGRTLIIDMRDEWMEKDQALGLFLVIMNTLAQAEENGSLFNKLMVFDEAHKYISESGLIGEVVAMIREMRHWATSVVIASQDPLSVPRAIIELTSVLILHRMTSPQWLKHLRSAIVSLNDMQDAAVTSLMPGEALVWAQRSTDKRYTLRPQKLSIRPRFTQHGGGTKTAINGATIR